MFNNYIFIYLFINETYGRTYVPMFCFATLISLQAISNLLFIFCHLANIKKININILTNFCILVYFLFFELMDFC